VKSAASSAHTPESRGEPALGATRAPRRAAEHRGPAGQVVEQSLHRLGHGVIAPQWRGRTEREPRKQLRRGFHLAKRPWERGGESAEVEQRVGIDGEHEVVVVAIEN